mmetsp:Transcript_27483/g.38760  ORF Transcript_27483/g.38760 Transcript_27483/m.38760 type:complete len:281 (+) Transcript_27483:71-913(+)
MRMKIHLAPKCKLGTNFGLKKVLTLSPSSHHSNTFLFRQTSFAHRRTFGLPHVAFIFSNFPQHRRFSNDNNQHDQQNEHKKTQTASLKSTDRGQPRNSLSAKNRSVGLFLLAIILAFIGLTYASVPLYRLFCQAMGFGGTVQENSGKTVASLAKRRTKENLRSITISFNSDVSPKLPWKFRPAQNEVTVAPGESVLAFYSAVNTSDKPITGISTYNITPHKAGVYFNKIQCFCFEQQRLEPHEQVELPVFFYIDPSILDDPNMSDVTNITLSYTFFKSDD